MRFLVIILVCLILWVPRVVADTPIPPGLNPGDHYQLIFATSVVTAIDSNTQVPPAWPFFGGLAAADWGVTFSAWQANILPNWNFVDPIYHAVLSTNGHDAKDRISIQAPLYNTQGELIAND